MAKKIQKKQKNTPKTEKYAAAKAAAAVAKEVSKQTVAKAESEKAPSAREIADKIAKEYNLDGVHITIVKNRVYASALLAPSIESATTMEYIGVKEIRKILDIAINGATTVKN